MYKPGQTLNDRARELTNVIEAAIKELQKEEIPNLIINEYDVIETHIRKILEHPECPKCGSERLTGECGHVWEVRDE